VAVPSKDTATTLFVVSNLATLGIDEAITGSTPYGVLKQATGGVSCFPHSLVTAARMECIVSVWMSSRVLRRAIWVLGAGSSVVSCLVLDGWLASSVGRIWILFVVKVHAPNKPKRTRNSKRQRQRRMKAESCSSPNTGPTSKCEAKGLPPFLWAPSPTGGCPDVESWDFLGDLRMGLGGFEASASLGGKRGKGRGLIGGRAKWKPRPGSTVGYEGVGVVKNRYELKRETREKDGCQGGCQAVKGSSGWIGPGEHQEDPGGPGSPGSPGG